MGGTLAGPLPKVMTRTRNRHNVGINKRVQTSRMHLNNACQGKLALEFVGRAMADEKAGPITCGIWMRKKERSERSIGLTCRHATHTDPRRRTLAAGRDLSPA